MEFEAMIKTVKQMIDIIEADMNKIIVEVHDAGNNYSASIPLLPGVVVTGDTIAEIEQQMKTALPFHLEGQRQTGGVIPEEFNANYQLVFSFSTETLLNYYSGIFTKAALSRVTGINERQLWHYAAGKSHPRPSQADRIKSGLHQLGRELLTLDIQKAKN
jgi:predicted RNase H-like HicB family nuclease